MMKYTLIIKKEENQEPFSHDGTQTLDSLTHP